MASSLISAAKTFLHPSHPQTPPPLPLGASPTLHCRLPSSRRTALRVTAQKWEPSKVVPQADRVLIRLEELPEKSAGGVLLPKSAVKFERYLMGEILSVGTDVGQVEAGKKSTAESILCGGTSGEQIEGLDFVYGMVRRIGSKYLFREVLFSDINAYEVDLGTDAKHCFCRAGDLLAVVE